MTVLCVGDINLDLTMTLTHDLVIGSDTAGTIEMFGGGSAANTAAWIARAGRASRFIGAVGDDTTGELLVRELRDHGVDVRPVRRPAATSRAVGAIIGPDGDRSLVSDMNTAMALTTDDFADGWFDEVTWLHLTAYTYIAARSRGLFGLMTAAASTRGIPFSIDPSAAQLLRSECVHSEVLDAFGGAGVLFPSVDEAEYLSGSSDPAAAANALLDIASCVVVTCGPAGAHVARRNEEPFQVDADAIEVVNTLGCGDAFAAGFIGALVDGHDDRQAARAAIRLATKAAQMSAAR